MKTATHLLIGASIVALGVPAAALAQATSPASGPPGQSTGGETVAVPPTGGTQPAQETGGLQEIIVTAAKVTSNAQKLPLAIQTFSGEELLRAGVSNVQELNKLLTGVQVQQSGGGNASFFIRGIGSTVLNAFADPANAFSVDGVFFSRPSGPGTTLYDVARIEVLKGPQGTLYGRNATGGAFNIITNRPTQVLSADAALELGNYNEKRFNAAVNVPVSDTLAIRAATQINRHDGYLSDGYDDEDTDAVRLSALWKPTPTITVFVSGDYAHTGGMGSGQVPVGPAGSLTTRFVVPDNPWTGPSDPRIQGFTTAQSLVNSPGILLNTPTTTICLAAALPGGGAIPLCSYPLGVAGVKNNGFVDNDDYGANLTVDADLGFATLTAIGGYRGTKTNSYYYIDPTPQGQQTDVNQYSIETRLASNDRGQRLKWIVGFFGLDETQKFNGQFASGPLAIPNPQPAPGSALPETTCLPPAPNQPPFPPGLCAAVVTVLQDRFTLSLPHVEDKTYAFFGQATYSLRDTVRVTGGLRYTHEDKDSENGVSSQYFSRPAGVVTSYPSAGAISFSDVSGRADIEVDVAPRSMLYAAFANAYHAGGLNLGVPQGPNTYEYKPEHVNSYTFGIKNRLFGNTVQLNVEAFWLDYRNLQVSSLARINDGSVACSTLNIAAACPLALRTDNAGRARFRGVEGDGQWQAWRGGLLFANVLYNDSSYLQFSSTSQTGAVTSYNGEAVAAISKVTITAGVNQTFDVGGGYRLIPEVRTQYRSGAYLAFQHTPADYQSAYTRTDATLTLQAPARRWSLGLFVRNLENNATLLQGAAQSNIATAPFQNLNPPRTFGAIGSVHF